MKFENIQIQISILFKFLQFLCSSNSKVIKLAFEYIQRIKSKNHQSESRLVLWVLIRLGCSKYIKFSFLTDWIDEIQKSPKANRIRALSFYKTRLSNFNSKFICQFTLFIRIGWLISNFFIINWDKNIEFYSVVNKLYVLWDSVTQSKTVKTNLEITILSF